ncbi:MAG: DUF3014 domain-containing protein [Casimicrobiaceae bacterium]
MSRSIIILGAAIVAALVGVGAWYLSRQVAPPPPPLVATPAPPPPVAAPAAPAEMHPVQDAPLAPAAPAAEAVPLDHSDATMRDLLAGLFADHALPSFLRVDRIVRNVVAAVDALPRDNISPTVIAFNPVPGRMVVAQDGDAITIAAGNAARYSAYVNVVKSIDAKAVARIYLGNYPLFQQAYRELGYPNGYFNDRLVTVIDVLLATPDIDGPIALAQPKVVYTYADPALEALPAGQKILLRMGRENAAVVKAKLREFRSAIVRAPPS